MVHFNVMLMYSKPYSIENEKTHKVDLQGVSVEYYFFGQNGEQLAPVADDSGDMGIRRSKASLPYEMKEKLMFVPGIYDGDFEMAVGSDGKPVLKLIDIDFIGKVNMSLEPMTPFDSPAEAQPESDDQTKDNVPAEQEDQADKKAKK